SHARSGGGAGARGGTLRIHRAYVYASDRVLRAIVTFLNPRNPGLLIRRAEREILAFPVEDFVPATARPGSVERARPGDAEILQVLRAIHRRLNRTHFGERLEEIPLRLSGRM